MDPNTTLEEILYFANNLKINREHALSPEFGQIFKDYALELAQKVQDLDNWLKKGGFIPVEWEASIHASVRKMDEEE